MRKWWLPTLLAMMLLGLSYILSKHSYLLFHSLVELLSATVSITVFSIGWQARPFRGNQMLVVAAVGFLFVGILDSLHALAYRGMGVFATESANLATQLWVASRYTEALTLVAAVTVTPKRERLSENRLLAGFGLFSAALILAIMAFDVFPDCYVEGLGLTTFKIISEYIICGILFLAVLLLQSAKEHVAPQVRRLLTAAMVTAILSELTFTLYFDVYGILNFLGHILKLVAVMLVYAALVDGSLRAPYSTIFRDLTLSQMRLQNLFNNLIAGFVVCEVATDEDPRFVIDKANPEFARLSGSRLEELVGHPLATVFPGLKQTPMLDILTEVAETGQPRRFEFSYPLSGRHYEVMAYVPEPGFVAFTLFDITERVHLYDRLKDLSYRDELTGLSNRTYLDEKLDKIDGDPAQLPISLVVGDLNGLKLVNDAFGHAAGDKHLQATADLFRSHCRQDDLLVRWGGDEFVLILPQTTEEEAVELCARIYTAAMQHEKTRVPLSIALGMATKTRADQSLAQALLLAEERMYRRKLLESRSVHSMILMTLRNTLQEKSFETEEHCERLGQLATRLGRKLELTPAQLDEIQLAASLHDIGKIGINDAILRKPTSLDNKELEQIRKHPEIGYRIVSSIPEVASVANAILHHHEWWNGNGYPKGLSGEDIPLSSRILAIADAYDVMTHNRPYKRTVSKQAALLELNNKAGIQFDPHLVAVFTALMTKASKDHLPA